MKALCYVLSFLLCLLLAQNTTPLQWASTPKNGEILYTCVNRDVTFAWDYTLAPGDVITSIEWNYEGRSQETMAAYRNNNFRPTPAFAHRIQHVPEAGLILHHVTKGDAGNYSITVTGLNSSGAAFTERRTVLLQVADDLMTTDHKLHAAQQVVAEYDNLTQSWYAVLTCGHFTYPTVPPISVDWLTPTGETLSSTAYSQGQFKLHLPNPVQTGNYSCRITASTVSQSCSHGHGQQATVLVDGVLTRLTLMEASLLDKDAEITNLQTELQALKDRHSPPAIAFTARLSTSLHPGNGAALIMDDVILNQGGAYNATTGRFTAPLSGTYFFSAFAAPYSSSNYAVMYLTSTGGGRLFYSWAYSDDRGHPQTGSLHGALRLRHGDQVWPVSEGPSNHFSSWSNTAFSGHLLFVD